MALDYVGPESESWLCWAPQLREVFSWCELPFLTSRVWVATASPWQATVRTEPGKFAVPAEFWFVVNAQ